MGQWRSYGVTELRNGGMAEWRNGGMASVWVTDVTQPSPNPDASEANQKPIRRVIPAQAGIPCGGGSANVLWIPACAGMTEFLPTVASHQR